MSGPMTGHFLKVSDYEQDFLMDVLDRAIELEREFHARLMSRPLKGKRIALMFEDTGFRNRVAFELGIRLMGGEAVFVPGKPGENESPADIARYLSNWFDAIVIRTPEMSVIEEMTDTSEVPVINARTRHNHPCEILGDLAFVLSQRGNLNDLKVVFVGEATNLCHSWFEAAAVLPIHVVQVCPPGYEVAAHAYPRIRISHDLEQELKDADVVYTDCWPARRTAEETTRIDEAFAPYRITAARLDLTPADCLFLPCPPVTRGEEVSADAMDSPKCRVYQAKEYLLHAQNALLTALVWRE